MFEMVWAIWWVWIIAALALATLEVVAPAQIFLGFAIGALGVGVALLVGVPGLANSLPMTSLVFAVLSLIAWIGVRRMVGVREGQVKIWEKDINED
jgi:membrane protein implicated in regulation of membrane protease activity